MAIITEVHEERTPFLLLQNVSEERVKERKRVCKENEGKEKEGK